MTYFIIQSVISLENLRISLMSVRILFFILLTACGSDEKPPAKTVEIKVMEKENFLLTMRLFGTIEAKQTSILTAKTSGAVDFLTLPGAALKRGEVIAEIEAEEAKRAYVLAEKAYMLSKTTYERALSLAKSKTASAQEVDDRQGLMIAKEKEYLAAKNALDLSTFRAPFDGVVGVFQVREGAHMMPGDVLCAFYKPGTYVISFNMPEQALSHIKGSTTVRVDGKSYPLTHMQRMLDPKTHMSPASFDFPCDASCILGQTVDIDLVLKHEKEALVLPLEAIYYQGGEAYVYTIIEGKAMPTKVILDERSEGNFLVKEGLKVGDQVIIKNISRLWPTVDVIVHEEKEKTAEASKTPEKGA